MPVSRPGPRAKPFSTRRSTMVTSSERFWSTFSRKMGSVPEPGMLTRWSPGPATLIADVARKPDVLREHVAGEDAGAPVGVPLAEGHVEAVVLPAGGGAADVAAHVERIGRERVLGFGVSAPQLVADR